MIICVSLAILLLFCDDVYVYIYMRVLKETESGTRRESLTPLQHCQWFLFCVRFVPHLFAVPKVHVKQCGKLINALKEVPSKETPLKYL